MNCCPPTAQHPRARPTLHARSLPSHHLRTLSTCLSPGPARPPGEQPQEPPRVHTQDTEAREERDQQPPRAAHLHTPRPLPGCPGCHVLPRGGAGPTNPPETRRCFVRGTRGRAATRLDLEWEPRKTRDRSAPQLRGGSGLGSGLTFLSTRRKYQPFFAVPCLNSFSSHGKLRKDLFTG